MTDSRRRLTELLDFVLDGSCTDDERVEFARLIEENPELIRELAEDVFMHSLLQWQSADVVSDLAETGMSVVADDSQHAKAAGRLRPKFPSAPQSPSRLKSVWWVVAASLVLVAGFAFWRGSFSNSWHQMAVAEVIAQEEVVWAENSTALQDERFIMPGRLQSSSGNYTLQFRSGPVVRVSGPSSMMIESDMLVHLDRGRATARVPESMTGFTIETPVINVIDQGTEFGVATREDGFTDVIVFDGKVDLQDSISSQGCPKRLEHGEAARVDRQGALRRIMQVGRDPHGGWWTADDPTAAASVIKEVRDNIPPSDGSKYFCYQVTLHGLRDDVSAYGDRHPHEWNGLSAAGLPPFLLGADYVKTFNDYRYLNDFEMVVELAQPANLYIFFDDRVPLPKWLTEGFVDTGVDIGLDEGPWEGIPDHRNAVGGGNSIDNVFSVWLRRCEELSPVTLGPVGDSSEARAMYGIAATPLTALGPPANGLQPIELSAR